MKSAAPIVIIIFVLIFASACAKTDVDESPSVNESEAVYHENDGDTESENENVGEDEIEEYNNNGSVNILDGINVNRFFSMTLGEVISLLGPDHSEPYFFQGSTCIEYSGSCYIYYYGAIEEDKEPQIELNGKIVAIAVTQEVEVYKGISVGKTFEQINNNTDLKNKLEIGFENANGSFSATPNWYENNGNYISTWIDFDENRICREIFLKLEALEHTSSYNEI